MKEIGQDEMEVIVNRTIDYDGGLDLSFAEFAKEYEEEWETVPTKGTRHPSTRAERRKKTAHAKERKTNTIRTREMRKYPYSLMLGRGKRHDHVWVGERSIIESRAEEKLASELRDWEISTIPEEVEYYDEDLIDELFAEMRELKEKLEEKEAFIRFLQSQIRI